MALWLDLIPKLHRADGHDDGFDQRGADDDDDDDNDDDRESPPLADDLLAGVPAPSRSDDVEAVSTGATSTPATYSARKLFLRSPPPPTSVRPSVRQRDPRPTHADGRPTKSTTAPTVALAATLAIGFLALIINCVIFVVVYRRRVSLKRLPTNDNHFPPPSPSPTVNVVSASTKSSAQQADGRCCADGTVPRGRHQQSATMYVADDNDADARPDVELSRSSPSPAGRYRSIPSLPPPPPPPPPSRPSSSHSPVRCPPDGSLSYRLTTDHGNHVSYALTSEPRTSASASNVWVQLTTTH